MQTKTTLALALSPVAVVGGIWGYNALTHDLDSYEARYSVCMEVAKSWQPGYQFYFPSPEYTRVTEDCEKQANINP